MFSNMNLVCLKAPIVSKQKVYNKGEQEYFTRMNTSNIILPIMFICFFQANFARLLDSKSRINNWLGRKLIDVKNNCEINYDESLSLKIFVDYHDQLLKYTYVNPTNSLTKEESYLFFYYIYNPTLIEKLKTLLKNVQNCLDDEDRLNSEDLVQLLSRILNAHAMKVIQVNPVTDEDFNCLEKVDRKKLEKCNDFYPHLSALNHISTNMTIYQFLTLGIGMDSTCEELWPFQECYLNLMSVCTTNARKIKKIQMSPPEISICKNFHQETHFSFIRKFI